ncbi:MAG: Cof-type HAD-IIB family hydrolase [Lachnospiraceae bacterium]|nr:Cof-type HAD-IIB family hydrolase [Lachnospiraceae bacterium]
MNQKILFTDLDGTLLNDEKKISPVLHATLQKIQKNGHVIVLSSGRPLGGILPVKKMLQLDDHNLYISSNNGSQVLDCSRNQCIMEKRVPLEDIRHILQIAEETDTYCQTYTDTQIVSPKEGAELSLYTRHIHMPYLCTDDIMGALTKEPFKLLAIDVTSHAHLEAFQKALYPWAEGRISTLFSAPQYLELFSSRSGKGNALRELCQHLDIPIENAMAAGDMDNDITMLEAAGTGVAMANATEGVKAIADIITEADNNHDGLVPVLLNFFEIEQSVFDTLMLPLL